MNQLIRKTLCAIAILAAVGLAGCEADGNAADAGGITDGGDGDGGDGDGGSSFPNDGTTPTIVNDGGPPQGTPPNGDGTGDPIPGRFICEASVRRYGPNPDTFVATGGLVGGPLTALLNTLGGDTATRLLNSVVDLDLAIDGDLRTASKFTLSAGLLLGLVDSVDQVIVPDDDVPSGNYAVFAVSFPTATLELSVLNAIRVTTFRDEEIQERATVLESALDLLGVVQVGRRRAFIGLKTQEDYDAASIGIVPGLVTANVGEAMYVHELCTRGRFIDAP